MTGRPPVAAALLLTALLSPSGLAAQRARPAPRQATGSPVAVARAFYAFHFGHPMGFTAAAVQARGRWLSPGLLSLCRAYFARPSSPDEAPAVDGDPFTDSQEFPQGFAVGQPSVRGDVALVPVTMRWRSREPRVVTLVLTGTMGSWLIADVRYAEGPSLRMLLTPGR